MRRPAVFLLAVLGSVLPRPAGAADAVAGRVFCNPMNLDYGWSGKGYRHSADPVIVLFKDRYYLFATDDVPGCRVSDDLLTWSNVLFDAAARKLASDNDAGGYCAPAVATDGRHVYFIRMSRRKGDTVVPVLRSGDPASGRWEKCGKLRKVGDPALFFDDGRAWLYHGLGQPTKVFEIDAKKWAEILGSERQLRQAVTNVADFVGGYERGRREIFGETDTAPFLDRFSMLPCQEAAWMTKWNRRYYLQYATPGTVSQWYCDVVMEGDAPTGPFRLADYAPASLKAGGFMGSAGHSCVFRDRHGNWWRVTTMWVGVYDLFERRLGLFPVSFDGAGRMRTDTALGDYPQNMPDGPRDPAAPHLAGWWVQSCGAAATASSSLSNHPPALAADENIRTWWSAESGRSGEWFRVDLGRLRKIQAVQVNFAEQDCRPQGLRPADDAHRYRLEASPDGDTWAPLADRSANTRAVPHDFIVPDEPVTARHLRVVNVYMPAGGRFALRDLRVFGQGGGAPPPRATGARVRRHDDDRNFTMSWTPSAGADGYLVRYGVATNALYQCVQVQGGTVSNLTLHTLNRGVAYAYRVDAFNDSGRSEGEVLDPGR